MTLVLHLPPLTERKLQELATQTGQDVADYTLGVIEKHLHACSGGDDIETDDLLRKAVARMTERTPKQLAQAREHASQYILPGKPLPLGVSLIDVVSGSWPGDESDERVAEALEKLS